MFETLEIFRDGQVATIWMNRPERHNAFNAQVIAELTQAFEAARRRSKACASIVLAGRGKSFSAGADLNWMKAAGEAGFEDNLADARKLATMLRRLAEMPKPTIARVHGAALGGGMGLAAACDICVAATAASFRHVGSQIRPHPLGHRSLCPARHRARARPRAISSPPSAFARARRVEIGLAHEVVEADRLDAGRGDAGRGPARGRAAGAGGRQGADPRHGRTIDQTIRLRRRRRDASPPSAGAGRLGRASPPSSTNARRAGADRMTKCSTRS